MNSVRPVGSTIRATRRTSCRAASRLWLLPAILALGACKDGVGPRPAKANCDTPGTVQANGQKIPVAPNGFAVVGNKILSSANCEPFRFVGVSRPSLSFTSDGGRLAVESETAEDFARIRGWRANTVRIELAQYFWLPTARFYDPGYAARVDRVIRQARTAGLYVILALQHTDRGDPNYPGDPYTTNMHQPLADAQHSIPFWKDVAARYQGDGGILYELFSEPHPIGGTDGFSNWPMWQNGGPHPADQVYEPRAAFQAVGMQQLYDAVRSTGAHNITIISGTQWGYRLDGVPAHRIKGYNIAYAAHPWSYEGQRAPATWDRDWTMLTATDPVMLTEFGNYDCTPAYPRAVLDKADQLGLSWIAWAWMAPNDRETKNQNGRGDPICEFPMLLVDYDGTPSRLGQLVKDRLSSY